MLQIAKMVYISDKLVLTLDYLNNQSNMKTIQGNELLGNYVIYMGKNEDIQEIIDNHFQKEPVMSI